MLDWSRFLNDHMSTFVSRHPKRFVGLCTVPLQVCHCSHADAHPLTVARPGCPRVDPMHEGFNLNSLLLHTSTGFEAGGSADWLPCQQLEPGRRRTPTLFRGLLSDERAILFIKKAAEHLGAAVFVHPWDMSTERMEKYWMPWLVGP